MTASVLRSSICLQSPDRENQTKVRFKYWNFPYTQDIAISYYLTKWITKKVHSDWVQESFELYKADHELRPLWSGHPKDWEINPEDLIHKFWLPGDLRRCSIAKITRTKIERNYPETSQDFQSHRKPEEFCRRSQRLHRTFLVLRTPYFACFIAFIFIPTNWGPRSGFECAKVMINNFNS